MASPVIRPFQPTDVSGVFELILPIQQQEFGIAIEREDQPDLSDIPSFYQKGAGGFWVAEDMGRIVGTIALKELGSRRAALRKMFVASPYRGSAHGLGAKLLDTLAQHARRQGVGDIYLGTTEAFLAAHRFYEKNGFKEVARSTLQTDFPVMEVDRKFYRMALP